MSRLSSGPRPVLGSTSAVFKLLRGVALDDQESAGLQCSPHAGPFQITLIRRAKLREDLDYHIEGFFGIVPLVHVGELKSDFDISFYRQGPSLGLR